MVEAPVQKIGCDAIVKIGPLVRDAFAPYQVKNTKGSQQQGILGKYLCMFMLSDIGDQITCIHTRESFCFPRYCPEPFVYKIVQPLVDYMGDVFPEIKAQRGHIELVIKTEEEQFSRTLETGIARFEDIAAKVESKGGKIIPGEDVFKLYDSIAKVKDLADIIIPIHAPEFAAKKQIP